MLRDRWFRSRKANGFTLQWHLTNACELHCAHCYDRSKRTVLDVVQARAVLAQLRTFCAARRVGGHVCLTGGNPFLYAGFLDLYREIAAAGMPISILGNPVPRERIAAAIAIQKPLYFQVSLEGLEAHNDQVRGTGNFALVTEFLSVLRELGVRSHVMLTLTRDNVDQVVPLTEYLRERVDRFTFNRLSPTGRGRVLRLPDREQYIELMKRYTVASRTNPTLAFKDGLFNIFRHHFSRPLTRGCTGFGCGAAFNFVALLSDGEVHACRKFPSLIGNVRQASLGQIYDSAAAKRYRAGCRECRFCPVRNVCGGCMAVTHGHGLDVFARRDPYCFMAERGRYAGGF